MMVLAGTPLRPSTVETGKPLRVGLVNNMPDPAFADTHRRLVHLLAPLGGPGVELTFYLMPSIDRAPEVVASAGPYRPVADLLADRPDALVVTGIEPRMPRLDQELYWSDLRDLLCWAVEYVPSVLLSCLASHAALLALHGIERRRLPAKQSGVFQQAVDVTHPLTSGLGPHVAFPHSRLNEVPAEALLLEGYRILVADGQTGWTVATRQNSGRRLTLLQGHPEYGRTALLKEYRRDVRRHLEGTMDSHPDIPYGYLTPSGEALLRSFRARCESELPLPLGDFPYDAAAAHIAGQWLHPAERLFANWVVDARALAVTAGV